VVGVSLAAPIPSGEKETFEPQWHFDLSGARATYAEVEPNNSCATVQPVQCGDVVDPAAIDAGGDYDY
jgi:hypothetical protein